MNKILVVLEDRDQARPLMEKAVKFARACGAGLHIYKHSYNTSIDDFDRFFSFDNLEDMKKQLLEDETRWLEEFVAAQDLAGVDNSSVVRWNRRLYRGVLDEVGESGCDLILKAANVHNTLYEIVRTPDDWSLMREANRPVMLVRTSAQEQAPAPADGPVMAAINPLEDEQAHKDLHKRVLDRAVALAKALNTRLIVVTAVPLLNYNTPYFIGAAGQYPDLQQRMRADAKAGLDALLKEYGVEPAKVVIEDGSAEHILQTACDDNRAQLLVIGTVANKGITGVLLGNTAERILHYVNQDVLVVD